MDNVKLNRYAALLLPLFVWRVEYLVLGTHASPAGMCLGLAAYLNHLSGGTTSPTKFITLSLGLFTAVFTIVFGLQAGAILGALLTAGSLSIIGAKRLWFSGQM